MVVSAAIVRQVLPAREVTPVPLTWPHIAGVLVTGGGAVPVCRLALLPVAGAPPGEPASSEKEIVIIEQDGIRAGFLIERADRMERPPEEPDQMIDGGALFLAAGIFKRGADGQTAAQAAIGEI
jgi:chemotaxis signal transduction protein